MAGNLQELVEQIRQAYAAPHVEQIGALLADDVHWGEEGTVDQCRNRADVLAVFARGLSEGVEADLIEVDNGKDGVLCGLDLRWPAEANRPRRIVFHVYRVEAGRIVEIKAFDDRASAMASAGMV